MIDEGYVSREEHLHIYSQRYRDISILNAAGTPFACGLMIGICDLELHVSDGISHATFHVCCDTLSALDELTNWSHGIWWIGIRGYCLCVR